MTKKVSNNNTRISPIHFPRLRLRRSRSADDLLKYTIKHNKTNPFTYIHAKIKKITSRNIDYHKFNVYAEWLSVLLKRELIENLIQYHRNFALLNTHGSVFYNNDLVNYITISANFVWEEALANLFFVVTKKGMSVYLSSESNFEKIRHTESMEDLSLSSFNVECEDQANVMPLDNFTSSPVEFINNPHTSLYIFDGCKMSPTLQFLASLNSSVINLFPQESNYNIFYCLSGRATYSKNDDLLKKLWIEHNQAMLEGAKILGYRVTVLSRNDLIYTRDNAIAKITYLHNLAINPNLRSSLFLKVLRYLEDEIIPSHRSNYEFKEEQLNPHHPIKPLAANIIKEIRNVKTDEEAQSLAGFVYSVAKHGSAFSFFSNKQIMDDSANQLVSQTVPVARP